MNNDERSHMYPEESPEHYAYCVDINEDLILYSDINKYPNEEDFYLSYYKDEIEYIDLDQLEINEYINILVHEIIRLRKIIDDALPGYPYLAKERTQRAERLQKRKEQKLLRILEK